MLERAYENKDALVKPAKGNPGINEVRRPNVPQEVRDDLTFIPVERIEEVLGSAFDHEVTPAGAHV